MLRSNMSCELWWTSGSRSGGHKAGAKGEFGVRVVVLRVIATEGQREVRRVSRERMAWGRQELSWLRGP